jgi:hypothetical protein
MPLEFRETTVPASADCGMRTFQVRSVEADGEPVSAIDVSVVGLEVPGQTGEVAELMEIRDSVPSNRDLGMALINLGTALLNTVGEPTALGELN